MRKLSMEELERPSVEEYRLLEKLPVTLVLDNIRSMLNIGSAFRTADAFAIREICLCGITAQPPHREINRSALGATESVDWRYFESTEDCIRSLKADGNSILAVEQAVGSTMLNSFRFSESRSYALVFGNEVFGVSDEVMEIVDGCLEIPQFGTKHSLNISVTTGVILWEASRQMRAK